MRFLLLLPALLWSCSGESIPKGVLPPEKMEAVLYDVIRADELADFSLIQDSTYRKLSKRTALYDSVFRLHKITKEDYRHSMNFYQSRPDRLKKILESLRATSDTALKRLNKDTAVKL